jgi:hypothetical protein
MPDDMVSTLEEIRDSLKKIRSHGDNLRWFTFGIFVLLLLHVLHHW